ncbi:MAG: peptidylprolyl isomerase [candidate division WWE3 bacterium]|nr:peptidylprolyl isomerase [candidate division WWE3 bacterium]
MIIDATKKYTATMSTAFGDMTFDLFASEDPLTVNNFVFLSSNNFYNGLKFHRIIADFMIQGGDPVGNGTGGPGYKFADEKVTREYVVGTLAMANSGPNTNGSQFFIMTKDVPLPKNYTIFGVLSTGQDVLSKIAATPTTMGADGAQSKPLTDVIINTVTISTN